MTDHTTELEVQRLERQLAEARAENERLRTALIRAESDFHLVALDSSIHFRLQQDVKRARDNCRAAIQGEPT